MIHTLELHNLSCGGCAVTIRTALDIAGFTSVKVNILGNPHTVSAEVEDESHLELLKSVLRDHGYPLLEDEIPELPDFVEYDFS